MKTYLFFALAMGVLLSACESSEQEKIHKPQEQASPSLVSSSKAWFDLDLPREQRVTALVNAMTPAEKISQMYNEAPAIERLGVPAYNWWNEALHGVARAGKATVFPQAIGMAAMYDEALMYEIATAISDEARAKHHYYFENKVISKYTGLTFWSPNINIFRDPRWGRGQETYGEDPYLTGKLAVQFIKGLQGEDEKYLKTSAMAKHFAVHSGPEKSRHSDDYFSSMLDMYETYLPAFELAVREANVESIMCAYNRVNGEPACGNDFLLKENLRGKWGFSGHVVSDCGAISDFYDRRAHNLVRAPAAAAAWAVRSGTDLNCGTDHMSVFSSLNFALQRKMISETEIDQALTRLFNTRFKLGLFDPKEKVAYANIPMDVVGSEKHLALSEQAARQSLVLLKNNGILPLKKGSKVALIGPNANNLDVLLGNYNGTPINPITVLQGLQSYLGEENITYTAGTALGGDIYGHYEVLGDELFSHSDENGNTKPGLLANYYEAKLNPRDRYAKEAGEKIGEPVISRVDSNIDFYWQRSPIDNSVWDEFAVVWQGRLTPQESGRYRFQSSATIFINKQKVEAGIELQQGLSYEFKAERTFLRTEWGNPLEAHVDVRWLNEKENLVAQAVTVADTADVVIFVGGISPRLEGEEMPVELDGFDYGDRTHIKLPQDQQDLLEILEGLGKPVVMINFSGSAMALNWQQENLDAIVQAFYPGEATGKAVADLLWGEFSPSGKLPLTFYKSVDDLPGFKDYSMRNRTYKYYRGEVLYPFGHGLSYSEFAWSELKLVAGAESGFEVSAKLTNQGELEAAQVSQLYLKLIDGPEYLPQRKLIAFSRDKLAAGQSKALKFHIPASDFSYVDEKGERINWSGEARLTLGGGQPGYKASGNVLETLITLH